MNQNEFINLWIFRDAGHHPITPRKALETSKSLRPMYETLELATKAAGRNFRKMSYAVVPTQRKNLINAGEGQYFSLYEIHLGKGFLPLEDAIEYAQRNQVALR